MDEVIDVFQFEFDQDYNLKIKVDNAEKLQILSEFSKIYNQYEPMGKWFDDPNVPQAEKDKYSSAHLNALNGLNFLYGFMRRCGITDDEIKEFTKIPF